MRVPLSQVADMATYIAKNKIRPKPEWQKNLAASDDSANPFRIVHAQIPAVNRERKPHPMINKRFPLVMMLEPLHACNLTCTGCGRIREYETSIRERLSLEQCLKAVDECGAPMVSICGGEPLLYPEIAKLCEEILNRGRYIQLCTNGMFITKKLKEFKPHPSLVFNVHLDGMEKNHDLAVEREGVFKEAIEGVKAAKAAGFKVFTNTTVYRETDMNEVWVFGGERSRDFHDARRCARKIQGHRQDGQAVSAGFISGVYGVSEGRPRAALHRLGQPHVQREGLEGPVLPDHRRAS
jgi:sulfatase maturation enzyme AslB (radical SAM superfamily)